ncbi:hypothetical protein ACOMHN_012808 [Nucella lapillus]
MTNPRIRENCDGCKRHNMKGPIINRADFLCAPPVQAEEPSEGPSKKDYLQDVLSLLREKEGPREGGKVPAWEGERSPPHS